jgi:transglutaminase-like putative cysteine protease
VRFRLVHKLATYLLAATAFFTLASSGVLSTLTLMLVVLSGAVSWLADPETRLGLLLDRCASLLNIATLLFLAASVFQVARSFPDVDLSPFLSFVLFLLVYKLCQRRGNRDYLQIYVLSFLVMLAAAWTATSVVFVAGFAFYVVLATWTLILFHLRREIEENYIIRHASESQAEQVTATRVLNSRRVVGTSFFLTTGAVALVVLVGSSLVFAMVPRVGLGFLMGGVRRQIGIAGFSDEVRLGMHGLIATDNQTVVLRAQVPTVASIASERDRDRVISSLYWRGTVYDTYDNGQWLRAREDKTRTQLSVTASSADLSRTYVIADPLAGHSFIGRKAALLGTTLQTIEIVALSHPVAFALDRPVAFEISPPPTGSFTSVDLEPRWSGEVSLRMFHVNPANPYDRRQPMTDFMGASYRVYSRDGSPGKVERTALAGDELAPGAFDNYLRVPQALAPRVRDLASTITSGQPSPAAKVQAVVDWLKRTHGYTVDLKRDERIADPLEDFLFAEKAGHCEYFASAAAILLRLGGVPTRYVNGFLGGEWNDLRKVITVRENRAHSWVEAYLGEQDRLDRAGWVRVDATPAVGRISHMGIVHQLLDSAELFWGRWVVEYNASQQLLLAQRLGQRFGFSGRAYYPVRSHTPLSRKQVLVVTALVVLAVAIASQRKRLRGWRTSEPVARAHEHSEQPIFRIYQSTLTRLATAGTARLPSESPHAYLARMEEQRLAGVAVLARLTESYASARYGDIQIPPEVVAQLRREVGQIGLAS